MWEGALESWRDAGDVGGERGEDQQEGRQIRDAPELLVFTSNQRNFYIQTENVKQNEEKCKWREVQHVSVQIIEAWRGDFVLHSLFTFIMYQGFHFKAARTSIPCDFYSFIRYIIKFSRLFFLFTARTLVLRFSSCFIRSSILRQNNLSWF